MSASTPAPTHAQIYAAQNIREECSLFFHGFIESFGVTWKWESVAPHRSDETTTTTTTIANAAAAAADDQPASASGKCPVSEDATSCSSPAPPSNTSAAPPAAASGAGTSSLSLQVLMMPPWSLVEHDPKLWMLLRKNLLANLALAALTLAYVGLSRRLTASATTASTARAASPSPAWASNGTARPSTISTSPPPEALVGVVPTTAEPDSSFVMNVLLFWWLRLCLWALKYMGQWPFYTALQVIGLVWFSQLYRETWLVRKGWVLRGTRLREATTTSAQTAKSTAQKPGETVNSPTPATLHVPRPVGTARPWLAPICLNTLSVTSPAAAETVRVFSLQTFVPFAAHAALAYGRRVSSLVARILRYKGPSAPLKEWVLGDASAAAAGSAASLATARGASLSSAQAPAPDVFELLISQLESISEVLFKALATMSFAFFASCVERLPLVGTPLCVLLNAQLYAFYVFDYRYASQQPPPPPLLMPSSTSSSSTLPAHASDAVAHRGSTLTYQLRHFEQCWMYYAGYGIGSAVVSLWLTHHVGVIVSVCAMSVLYSWQVVWSGFAVPLPSSRPLPLFSLWFYAVDMVQRHFAVLWRSVVIAALLYIPYQYMRCIV